MSTQIKNAFTRDDTNALRRMLRNHKTPTEFGRNLIDELRDIANCDANSDTCKNKICQLAHQFERGIEGRDTLGRTTQPPLKTASTLKCPYCRYQGKKESPHGGTFRYLADQATWREIKGLKDNVLTVEGILDSYPEDPEHNERIECRRKCLSEFYLTPAIEVEFV